MLWWSRDLCVCVLCCCVSRSSSLLAPPDSSDGSQATKEGWERFSFLFLSFSRALLIIVVPTIVACVCVYIINNESDLGPKSLGFRCPSWFSLVATTTTTRISFAFDYYSLLSALCFCCCCVANVFSPNGLVCRHTLLPCVLSFPSLPFHFLLLLLLLLLLLVTLKARDGFMMIIKSPRFRLPPQLYDHYQERKRERNTLRCRPSPSPRRRRLGDRPRNKPPSVHVLTIFEIENCETNEQKEKEKVQS